jgi:hypothetical protein
VVHSSDGNPFSSLISHPRHLARINVSLEEPVDDGELITIAYRDHLALNVCGVWVPCLILTGTFHQSTQHYFANSPTDLAGTNCR